MDVFSTDGQLERLQLRLLEDDRRFFPDYSAVLLARREIAERFPRTWSRLREALEGRIDGRRMARLNAMADLDGKRVPEVAAAFLGADSPASRGGHAMVREIVALTLDHLILVLIPVGAAILLGVPMGVARRAIPESRTARAVGHRHAADDSRAGAPDVHDPALRDRQGAGAGRPVGLRIACRSPGARMPG